MTRLIAVGGFAGSGKTLTSERLSKELKIPRLCSDPIGKAIRERMRDKVPAEESYGAGYDVLFALCGEFLSSGCSVIVDMSLGWRMQWEQLDALVDRISGIHFMAIILHCPMEVCVTRIGDRHRRNPDLYPPVDRFMAQPQLPAVWDYLEALDRPDLYRVDAARPAEDVYADVRQILDSVVTTRGC